MSTLNTIAELSAIEAELVEIVVRAPLAEMHAPVARYSPDDRWCVYLCVHPRGFYYYGKGITQNVIAGIYKGSGTSLRAAWEWYPKDEWRAHVLETFPEEIVDEKDIGEDAAYAREHEIVGFDMLCDPFCLNDVPGGKGGWTWGRLSSRLVEKRKKSVTKLWADPVVRDQHRLGNVAQWSSEEARERHREMIRHTWLLKRNEETYQRLVEEAELKKVKVKKEKKAAKAPTKAVKVDYAGLEPTFAVYAATPVLSRAGVLKSKETLEQHADYSAARLKQFNQWLDDNDILRFGSEAHRAAITAREREENARRIELEKKIAKLLKQDDPREEMREKQLENEKTKCSFCGNSFRAACFGHPDRT